MGKKHVNKSVQKLREQGAAAWAKKKRVACFADLPSPIVTDILSFLTKKRGQGFYHEGEGGAVLHLNATCKLWFYALERVRTTPPPSVGGCFGLLQGWLSEKLARGGGRSNPVSPITEGSPHGPSHSVLVLADLAVPVSPTAEDSSDSSCASVPPVTSEACKEALHSFVAAGGSKKDISQLFMRLFRYQRTMLCDKHHVVKADMQKRCKDSQQVSELIRWASRDLKLDANVTDPYAQRTLLHLACIYNDVPSAKFLLQAGADLTLQDRRGRTPLHYAAREGCNDIAQLITTRGDNAVQCCLARRDADGKTPLEIASRFHRPLCQQIISKKLRTLLTKRERTEVEGDDGSEHGLTSNGDSECAPSVSSPSVTPDKKPLTPSQPALKAKERAKPQAKQQKKKSYFDAADEQAFAYAESHR